MQAPEYVCPQCGEQLLVDVDHDDASAERRVYGGEPKSSRDRAVEAGISALAQIAQGFLANRSAAPALPVAGKVDCKSCSDLLAGLRDSEVLLVTHLESGHDWWPADMDAALAELHKAGTRVSRGLRNVRYTEKTLVGDPYAAVAAVEQYPWQCPSCAAVNSAPLDSIAAICTNCGQKASLARDVPSEPDTTGTPANTHERLDAVLERAGPSPLYDPATDDLEVSTPAVHVLADQAPGSFLDGGGDAVPGDDVPAPEPQVPVDASEDQSDPVG